MRGRTKDDAQVDRLTTLLKKNGHEIRNSSIRAKPANQQRLDKGKVKEATIKRLLRMQMSWAGSVVWIQEDSHHSNQDGSPNMTNLVTDTGSVNVLISQHFYYFGCDAPEIDLDTVGYKNIRNYRKLCFSDDRVSGLVRRLENTYQNMVNKVAADPYDFMRASIRVDQSTGKIE